MADTIAQVHHDLDGIGSPVLLIFDPDNTDAALNNSGSGDSLAKATNREASWRATISESLAGVYAYEVRSGSTLIAWGFIHLLNDTNTHYGVDSYADAALSAMVEEDGNYHRLTRNALEQGGSVIASGVAQGGTVSTIQLAASEPFGDDILNGAVVKIISGTGEGQHRVITDYVGSTDTATVTPDFVVTPDDDSEYEVVVGMAEVKAIEGSVPTDLIRDQADDALEAIKLDHLIAASVGESDVADDSIIAKLVSNSTTAAWSDFNNQVSSLLAILNRGNTYWGVTQSNTGSSSQTFFNKRTSSSSRTLIQNDDYPLVHRPIIFTDNGDWVPSEFTGDTAVTNIKFTASDGTNTIAVEISSPTSSHVVEDGTGANPAEIHIPLTSTDTDTPTGSYDYDLQLTTSAGVFTVETGTLTVQDDVTDPN